MHKKTGPERAGPKSLQTAFVEIDAGPHRLAHEGTIFVQAVCQLFAFFPALLRKISFCISIPLALAGSMAPLVKSGELKCREDIRQGIDVVPACFAEMLRGDNFGEMLVQTAADPTLQSDKARRN